MTEFLTEYGYGFIVVVVLFESLALPLPGESLVVAAGMLASSGKMNILLVLGSAFLGSVLGDNIGYFIGRRYGRAAILKWGDKVGFDEDKLKMVEEKFQSYGFIIVLIARFVFILRQLNGFVAGMMHMNWLQFLLYNAISAALWTAAYGLSAYYFGKALTHFLDVHSIWAIIGISGSICAIGMYGTYKVLFDAKKQKKAKVDEQKANSQDEDGETA
ncbi:DedA family protein [Fulvimarina sp. MAC3]|uniref:DedA family protein n=1 Tax=Fulvimarina sp. MAC3 TaxID=3148887 RepID=UPI0031FCCEB5